MILAGLGVAFGALFSSGLMEVARKGIFNPGEFYFDEIMKNPELVLADTMSLDLFHSKKAVVIKDLKDNIGNNIINQIL